jgi:hypothetical protein
MPIFSVGPYKPDLIGLDQTASPYVRNVIPTASGWGPLTKFDPVSSALPAACRGAFMARNRGGGFSVFAATATNLYKRDGNGWEDVTRSSGAAYNLADGHTWDFEQFGEMVIAVQQQGPPQEYTIGSSANFEPLGGSPPNARFVWQESGYVGLGCLLNDETTIRRSGLNDATFWTVGLRGADTQEFPDGGDITGATGDEAGAYIFSVDKVRRLQNQPGQEIGFSMIDVEPARGTIYPESIVRVGNMIFFLTDEGFFQLGSPSSPIGSQVIDRTFLADVNLSARNQIQGVNDERRKIVWWRYASHSSDGTYSDKLIGYHWQLQRWTYAEINLEFLLEVATVGYTLEDVSDTLGYTDLETVPYSFDSAFWEGGIPTLGGFNEDHKLGFFSGPNMAAILETADIPLGGEGRRCFVRGFRPIVDTKGVFGSTGYKPRFDAPNLDYTAEQEPNVTGLIPQRASGRVMRFRSRIPAEKEWNNFVGVEVDAQPSGKR